MRSRYRRNDYGPARVRLTAFLRTAVSRRVLVSRVNSVCRDGRLVLEDDSEICNRDTDGNDCLPGVKPVALLMASVAVLVSDRTNAEMFASIFRKTQRTAGRVLSPAGPISGVTTGNVVARVVEIEWASMCSFPRAHSLSDPSMMRARPP